MLPLTRLRKYIIIYFHDTSNKFNLGVINRDVRESIYDDGIWLVYRFNKLLIRFPKNHKYIKYIVRIKPTHNMYILNPNNYYYHITNANYFDYNSDDTYMCDVQYDNYYNNVFHSMNFIYKNTRNIYQKIVVNYVRYYNAKNYVKYHCGIYMNDYDSIHLSYYDNKIAVIKIILNNIVKIYKKYF